MPPRSSTTCRPAASAWCSGPRATRQPWLPAPRSSSRASTPAPRPAAWCAAGVNVVLDRNDQAAPPEVCRWKPIPTYVPRLILELFSLSYRRRPVSAADMGPGFFAGTTIGGWGRDPRAAAYLLDEPPIL